MKSHGAFVGVPAAESTEHAFGAPWFQTVLDTEIEIVSVLSGDSTKIRSNLALEECTNPSMVNRSSTKLLMSYEILEEVRWDIPCCTHLVYLFRHLYPAPGCFDCQIVLGISLGRTQGGWGCGGRKGQRHGYHDCRENLGAWGSLREYQKLYDNL